jgi:hypothetical protein
MATTYMLATPDEARRAWIVRRRGLAAQVYLLDNPKAGDFTAKIHEAAKAEQSGGRVFFPR